MKYPYIIVDNDSTSVDAIQLYLENLENFVCTGLAANEADALNLILERKPALVFMEPDVPGTQTAKMQYNLLNELTKYMTYLPKFVVMTNTVNYAIEGIRNNIMDYILKPFAKADMVKITHKFIKDYEELFDNTLCVKSYGDYRFVNLDEILYLKADSNTTDFAMNNGTTVEAFKTLKHFQNLLPDHFVRIHNSYIINTKHVSRIHFGKAKCAIKNSNDLIPFSKSYKNNVEEIKDTLAHKSLVYV